MNHEAERPRSRSLAARLTLWYTICSFLLVLGATAYYYFALVSNLDRQNREFIADQVGIMRVLLRDHPKDLAILRHEVEEEANARPHARAFLRILSPENETITETPGCPPELRPAQFPLPEADEALSFLPHLVRDQRGRPYRLASARIAEHTVQVALETTLEEQLLAEFRGRSLPALAVLLASCGFIGHRIARHGIEPVRKIAKIAGGIGSATLSRRIEAKGLPTELSILAATMNGMLSRLEESFGRLERFSADIAHELRTPLGNLRGEAEVALRKDRPVIEYREVLGSALEEYAKLSRLIDSLLFLARAENPDAQTRRDAVDVAAEMKRVREFYQPAAEEHAVEIEVRVADGLEASLDRVLFQGALGNLIDNALCHTPPGGRVVLSGEARGRDLRVEVSDSGSGIAAEHLPFVFDRLYRVDKSRAAATGGAGLGLAIVKSIAELHSGSAGIVSELGAGTCITLSFPAAVTKS